ncbi:hypothetical protein HX776_16730 [Pseudomonas agarici]|uniref:hypothetical protein n=1 Tax=Pseudomonas agarici TaxID=46677 RepID=UPI00037374CD|nr:hypothetical protein [Pseudomonas agarici]NWC10455.1 hypothetical protein [Pseudomonas agarici]SEK24552.1 hypothetical protein SAMN05216604_101316 [Pseudomonas agarici]
MRTIAHKVKRYRKSFSGFPASMLRSTIFYLVLTQLILTLGAVLLYLFFSIYQHSDLYHLLPLWVLLLEVFLMFGFIQLRFDLDRKRLERLNPELCRVAFRKAYSLLEREKVRRIEMLFGPRLDLRDLARELIDEWEWRRSIQIRAGQPAERRARNFFGLPSAGNFATYLAGLIAVLAAVVVTLIDKVEFYQALPEMGENFLNIFILLTTAIVLPIAASVYPLAAILGGAKVAANNLLEALDDDYLSDARFYGFIKELLELEERKEKRLLMKTTGRLYWCMRAGMAPIGQVSKVMRNARRSVRIEKLRRAGLCRARA